jgi:hypothetical protein
MNTNWPDVFVALAFGATMVGGLCVGAYLVVNDHPWIGFFVILVVGTLKIKTGVHAS